MAMWTVLELSATTQVTGEHLGPHAWLIAVHVTSQTLYTEISNAVLCHISSWLRLYVCLHFATAHVPILTN